jgi:hypothetical protein
MLQMDADIFKEKNKIVWGPAFSFFFFFLSTTSLGLVRLQAKKFTSDSLSLTPLRNPAKIC